MAGQHGEAGHWYSRETGEQVPTVPAKKGGMKKTTVREAREMDLVKGCTTIADERRNPFLEKWKMETAAKAMAVILSEKYGVAFTPEELKGLVKQAVEEGPAKVASETADRGRAIHAAVDRYFSGDQVSPEFAGWVETVKGVLEALAGTDDFSIWQAEVDSVHPAGYGCRGDLACFSRAMYVDIKTRDFTADDVANAMAKKAKGTKDLGRLTPRQGEPLQIAANMMAMFGHIDATTYGADLYLDRTDPEIFFLHPYTVEELEAAWKQFLACLVLSAEADKLSHRVDISVRLDP